MFRIILCSDLVIGLVMIMMAMNKNAPNVYKLPQFPLWLQNMLDTHSPLCKEPRCRHAVIDALFDDLLRYGYYPTSRMFQETARALVEAHPILKDKQFANAQSHVPEPNEGAEDEYSIQKHIKVLQDECQKKKSDEDLLHHKMNRTFLHRTVYITNHTVADTLKYFPPLQKCNEIVNLLSPFLCYLASCKKNFHHYMLLKMLIHLLCKLIVHRNSANVFNNTSYELFLDKKFITKAENLVCASFLWFTLFWLFDVGYSQKHRNFLSFLDAFIFKKLSLRQVPRSVKSLYNNIQ